MDQDTIVDSLQEVAGAAPPQDVVEVEPKKESIADELDRRMAWAFSPEIGILATPVAAILLGLYRIWRSWPFYDGLQNHASLFFSELGGVMVCLGVFTAARPLIRLGGIRAYVDSLRGGPPAAGSDEAREQKRDARALQVTGPALAFLGTLVNAFSGEFG